MLNILVIILAILGAISLPSIWQIISARRRLLLEARRLDFSRIADKAILIEEHIASNKHGWHNLPTRLREDFDREIVSFHAKHVGEFPETVLSKSFVQLIQDGIANTSQASEKLASRHIRTHYEKYQSNR
jgi:Tfp pilus assembly protein PilE